MSTNVSPKSSRFLLPAGNKPQPRECTFPGCSTLTMLGLCTKHRPQANWQLAERVCA